ncbi:galactose-3-O-sulfotransferase 2-like isoform X2 [Argopecten irradians]|uniref:galactose-3-O-sulfotransferase 2-like isoform X2 n=1 Tax=Argopecten irradians TaxID=31199 RepID=UPI00371CE8FC
MYGRYDDGCTDDMTMDVRRYQRFLLGCCLAMTALTIGHYIISTEDERKEIWDRATFGIRIFSMETIRNPVNHILFVKVPKAASTTVQNIFLRYGDENNLTFALPSNLSWGGYALTSDYFYPPPENGSYDISCAHVPYNRQQFSQVLPDDTRYIAIVREPFSHFQTAVRFARFKQVLDIPGENPVLEYLRQERQNRTDTGRFDSNICNLISWYLGFPDKLFWNTTYIQIEHYLLKLEKEMDIILVFEHLDESIVLMRRILNWDLRHVLYGKLRVNKVKDPRLKFRTEEAELHKDCAQIDYQLYNFFAERLKEKIRKQSADYHEEVAYFRKTRIRYENFCLDSISHEDRDTTITFEGSAWNKPFVITSADCKKLFIHDVVYLDRLKKKQFGDI